MGLDQGSDVRAYLSKSRFIKQTRVSVPATVLACVICAVANAQPACDLEPGAVRTVTKVLDGETVALDDGSEVKLIGALAPRASDAGANPGEWPPEAEAIRALTRLVLGKAVLLTYGGDRRDRYGRSLAHVYVQADGGQAWVQGEMLRGGYARAYALPGNSACMPELLAHEREARLAKHGLWASGVYRIMPAKAAASLLQRRSEFTVVKGTIVSVSKTKSGVFLNCGEDWKSDFTVSVPNAVLAANAGLEAALLEAKTKTILVHGWIERRNGPAIQITSPAEIEGLEQTGDRPEISAAPESSSPEQKPDLPAADKRPDPLVEDPGATKL